MERKTLTMIPSHFLPPWSTQSRQEDPLVVAVAEEKTKEGQVSAREGGCERLEMRNCRKACVCIYV